MAQATTIRFGQQSILIGNGATPEVFTAPCGLTSLNKVTNRDTSTTRVPDCDDPDLATWLEIDLVSKQMVLSGTGVLAMESLPMWDDWDYGVGGEYRNVRWYRNVLGGIYYYGRALLTQFEESSEAMKRYGHSIAITFDGKPLRSPGAWPT